MSIFKKKGVVFVTAGLQVWAQTYLGVKFGIKTPSFTGVVFFFLFLFFFVFVLFCFVLFFFTWKDKTCLVISFTSDVHVYTITFKCPHPRIAEREMIFQARSQDRFGGCGVPKRWTFLNLTPLSLLQKPHFVAKSRYFQHKAPEPRLWVSRHRARHISAHNEATNLFHYSLFDYISFLYIMLGLRQSQIMES